jgi:hypothetical protein
MANRFGVGNLEPLTAPSIDPPASLKRDEIAADVAAFLAAGGAITAAVSEPIRCEPPAGGRGVGGTVRRYASKPAPVSDWQRVQRAKRTERQRLILPRSHLGPR